MSPNIAALNLIIAAAGLLMCLLCITNAYLDDQMERTARRFLIALFTVLCGNILLNIALLTPPFTSIRSSTTRKPTWCSSNFVSEMT